MVTGEPAHLFTVSDVRLAGWRISCFQSDSQQRAGVTSVHGRTRLMHQSLHPQTFNDHPSPNAGDVRDVGSVPR